MTTSNDTLQQIKQPLNQWTGHESRIQCLQWHPQEPYCFATSALEGTVKIWENLVDDQRFVPSVHQTGKASAWRFCFSVSSNTVQFY